MLKVEIIGNLGANAEVREKNGNRFGMCRVAHTETWVGQDGCKHESTQWVDVIIQADAKVIPYLLKGTQIFVRGSMSIRVYSSEKDRCMKAGITIRAQEIQLLSSQKKEETPTQVVTTQQTEEHGTEQKADDLPW